MIVCLRHSGVPVEKLIDYAEMIQKGDSTLQAREDLLKEQLANLKEKQHNLNRSIARLEHKITKLVNMNFKVFEILNACFFCS